MARHGPQGWWPLFDRAKEFPSPTDVADCADRKPNYRPGTTLLSLSPEEQFEVAVGSILTQNTSWLQVERALAALDRAGWLTPESLLRADGAALRQAIRPAGYFNQKSERLRTLSHFFLERKNSSGLFEVPLRGDLLALQGVGPETADSILLYAFAQPEFVVDAYSRRIWGSLGLLSGKESYDEVKALFVADLPGEALIYQEFHALLVAHAKVCKVHPSPAKLLRGVDPSLWNECCLAPLRRSER